MEKNIRAIFKITLGLGILAGIGLANNLYQVNLNLRATLGLSAAGYTVGIAYVFILLFHGVSFFALLIHHLNVKELPRLRIAALTLGVLSLVAIGVEKVMFDEIARETALGWEVTGEIVILNIGLLVNVLFTALMVLFPVRALSLKQPTPVTHAEQEEVMFTIAHYLGMFAGALGILLTLFVVKNHVILSRFWIYIPFYIMILIPYGLAAAFWLSLKLKVRIADWYDEKQWRDMLTASFLTLIVSIPGLALFSLTGPSGHVYGILYHLFLVLLLFSAGTLYFYRRG